MRHAAIKTPEHMTDAEDKLLNQTAGIKCCAQSHSRFTWFSTDSYMNPRCFVVAGDSPPPMSTGIEATRINVNTVGRVRICDSNK